MRNSSGAKKFLISFWGIIGVLWLLVPLGRAENEWRITINIPEYKLYLYRDTELYQCYQIAVGKEDSPSPVGNFFIVNKINNPTWYPFDHKRPPIPAGPGNPLGKFWLGLSIEGFGIHGNSAPWSIGSPVSLGCFRMHNQDIKRLFNMVPVGTPVEIIYRTVLGDIDSHNRAWLEVLPDIYHREQPAEALEDVFNRLGWIYQPHQKALQYLLPVLKRPCKIQIPRAVNIEGDLAGLDGFYWYGSVYVSRNILAFLPLTAITGPGNSFFDEYLDIGSLLTANNPGGLQIDWDEANNTLKLSRGTCR